MKKVFNDVSVKIKHGLLPISRHKKSIESGFISCALSLVIMLSCSAAYAKEAAPKPIFKLTQGQGTEVCDAYLQRLQATEFLDNDPTKGRVSEPLLKGFADLKTVPLTVEEVLRLYNKLKSFEQYQDQNISDKYNEQYVVLHQHEKGFVHPGQSAKQSLQKSLNQLMEKDHKEPLLRYQVMLDLDNDGKATDTVIKTTRDIMHPTLGIELHGLFIVDTKLQNVEEFRMKSIFGDQEILKWPTITQFPPLVAPINIFVYQGKYYFAGFDNLVVFESQGVVLYQQPPMYLKVFIHENYQTKQVCDYEWLNAEGTYPIYHAYD